MNICRNVKYTPVHLYVSGKLAQGWPEDSLLYLSRCIGVWFWAGFDNTVTNSEKMCHTNWQTRLWVRIHPENNLLTTQHSTKGTIARQSVWLLSLPSISLMWKGTTGKNIYNLKCSPVNATLLCMVWIETNDRQHLPDESIGSIPAIHTLTTCTSPAGQVGSTRVALMTKR